MVGVKQPAATGQLISGFVPSGYSIIGAYVTNGSVDLKDFIESQPPLYSQMAWRKSAFSAFEDVTKKG